MSKLIQHLGLFCFCLILVWISGCGYENAPTPALPAQETLDESSTSENAAFIESELERGKRLLAGGNPEAARRSASEILNVDPENAAAMMLDGQASIAIGDVNRGIELLDAAAERMPENWTQLNAQLAGILWQQNRLDETQQRFVNLLQKHPDFDEARRGLAMLLNRRGYRFDANQQIRFLCRRPGLQVTNNELRGLMYPNRPAEPFEGTLLIDDRDWVNAKGELNVIRSLFNAGRFQEALTLLEQGDLLTQGDTYAISFLGQILMESQQFDLLEDWLHEVESSEDLRTACKRYPEYWMAMGGWAQYRQLPRQAVHLFAEAIRREPGYLSAHDRIIQSLEAANESDAVQRFKQRRDEIRKSLILAERIVAQPDTAPDTYNELADLLEAIGRPFEGRCWRSFGRRMAGMDDDESQQSDVELAKLLASENIDQTTDLLICGLDPNNFLIDLNTLLPPASRDQVQE